MSLRQIAPSYAFLPASTGSSVAWSWFFVALALVGAGVFGLSQWADLAPSPVTTQAPSEEGMTSPTTESDVAQHPFEQEWQTAMSSSEDPLTGSDVQFVVTQDSYKKWDVLVKEVLYLHDQNDAYLKRVEGHFYDSQGNILAYFKSPYGKYQQDTQAIELFDQVSVTSGAQAANRQSITVQAPQVNWGAKADSIQATGGITLHNGQIKTKAQTATFKLDLSSIQLTGQVVTQVGA